MVYSAHMRPIFPYSCSIEGKYIHIGVGSDVACSTLIGNARASVGGTGNKTIPRFFVYFYILSNQKIIMPALGSVGESYKGVNAYEKG